MAPKKSKDAVTDSAAGLTEEQQAASQISQRLQAAAKSHGVNGARFCVTPVIRSSATANYEMQVLTGARRVTSQELPTPKRELPKVKMDCFWQSARGSIATYCRHTA